jgi:outer membrane protein assembly factor BamB
VNDQALVILYLVSGIVENSTPYRFVTLQPLTGEVLWKSTPGIYHDLITLQGSTLYAYDKGIVALNVRNASKLWQADLPDIRILASSATAKHLYIRAQNTVGSADGSVYAFDVQDGQVLWQVAVDSWAGGPVGVPEELAPIEANGVVYVVDTNVLLAYRATSGERLWQYRENPLPNDSIILNSHLVIYFSQPVIVGDVVFVANTLTYPVPPPLSLGSPFCLGRCNTPPTGILALSASSGKLYWRHEVPTSSRVALLTVSAS